MRKDLKIIQDYLIKKYPTKKYTEDELKLISSIRGREVLAKMEVERLEIELGTEIGTKK